MTGWQAGVVILVGIVAAGVWLVRRVDLDGHIEEALRLANDPVCACDQPSRRGWMHTVERCVPPTPGCECRGSLRDASGVMHSPVVCAPLRECVTDGRWGVS